MVPFSDFALKRVIIINNTIRKKPTVLKIKYKLNNYMNKIGDKIVPFATHLVLILPTLRHSILFSPSITTSKQYVALTDLKNGNYKGQAILTQYSLT